MTTTNDDQSGAKRRQRSRKPADRRSPKPDQSPRQSQNAKFDRRDEDRAEPVVTSTDVAVSVSPQPAEVALIGEVIPPDAAPSAAAPQPTAGLPIGIQTIANAYGDYVRQSLQENRSFVERLMSARSFEQAIEVQAEFARQAYANFVAESQKICELYSELARQMFRPWGGFAATITHVRRQTS
jgi:phasin family protein